MTEEKTRSGLNCRLQQIKRAPRTHPAHRSERVPEASAELVEAGAAEGPPLLPESILSLVEVVAEAAEFKSKAVNLQSVRFEK